MAYINGKEVLFAPVNSVKEVALQEEKAVEINANGAVEILPDEGCAAVKKVIATVNVESSGSDTSDATATEGDVVAGVTFYANGEKKTGTMPDYHSGDFAIGYTNGDSGELKIGYTAAQKTYFNAASGALIDTIQDPNFIAGNIKKGTSIFGVVGTYEGEGGSSGGEQPQLNAPVITSSGFTVNIDDTKNGNFADGYKVYANDTLVGTVTAKSIDMSTLTDTTKTFSVKVAAFADKFIDSTMSNILNFVVAEGTQGLAYTLRESYYAVANGTATDTDIVIPSQVDGIPVQEIAYNAFARKNITSIKLPPTITILNISSFYACKQLASVEGFENTGITEIPNEAFSVCQALTTIAFPKTLTKILVSAFKNCAALTSVRFASNMTEIRSDAFGNCTNLTDIYVPWAEGAVADAPWGADNATIHYNSEV